MTDPKHPWAVDVCGTWAMTCDASSRIDQIKRSTDVAWLRKVAQPKFSDQVTVREAAERRLRILARKAK